MKLISLNIEMNKHYDTVFPFLDREGADVLCLQEVPEEAVAMLEERGYQTVFLPGYIRDLGDGKPFPEGIVLASKSKLQNTAAVYNYKPQADIAVADDTNKRETYSQGFIIAETGGFMVAVTHFTWTPQGEIPNADQKEDLPKLLSRLSQYPPHILCGDFNIPRHHNTLYEDLIKHYTDTIPEQYKSSLDQNIHRVGNDLSKAKMFSDFIVDYIFTKPPYRAENVRLEFGVSDHAAVVADIYRK